MGIENEFVPQMEIPEESGDVLFLRKGFDDRRSMWNLGELKRMGLIVPEEFHDVIIVEVTREQEDPQKTQSAAEVNVQPVVLVPLPHTGTTRYTALVPIDDIPIERYRVKVIARDMVPTKRPSAFRVLAEYESFMSYREDCDGLYL